MSALRPGSIEQDRIPIVECERSYDIRSHWLCRGLARGATCEIRRFARTYVPGWFGSRRGGNPIDQKKAPSHIEVHRAVVDEIDDTGLLRGNARDDLSGDSGESSRCGFRRRI